VLQQMGVMRKLRVYLDSSVIGGAFNTRIAEATKPFWEAFYSGRVIVIASDILEDELRKAPQRARDFFDSLPQSQVERVVSTRESEKLAAHYVTEGVVSESSLDDCAHVALATLANADVIVSWNLKHMVKRSEEYKKVNAKLGYPQINIQTPDKEMMK